jgi:glycosyltransferase involved in cell wall biosynthesis
MERHPVVDVIVATNRASPYLHEALTSVVDQTWDRWRLTVVDDGGPDPDGLAAVVAAVPRSRVVHRPAGGLAAARNTGIAETDGELLVFLDDDDVWAPTRLERQVEALAAAPGAPCAYTGGWYLDGHGVPLGDGWPATPGTPGDMRALRVALPRITTLMCRREAVERVGGFDPSFPASEDIVFALALLEHGSPSAVDEPLVGYRRHDENMTRTIPMARQLRLHDRAFREALHRSRAAGDEQAAGDLRAGMRRSRATAAQGSLARVRHGLRAGDVRGSLDDLAWSAVHAPGAVLGSVLHRIRPD